MCMRAIVFIVLLGISALAQEGTPAPQPSPQKQAPTEISADLGSCSALFHVSDLRGTPLYNAQVHVLIRYGFMSKRRTELTAGTNADGRVKFVRLPNEVKKALRFDVSYGEQTATLLMDPATRCQAEFDVPLKVH